MLVSKAQTCSKFMYFVACIAFASLRKLVAPSFYSVSNRPSNVDEIGTGNYRRGLCTRASLRLDHMSTYDWTINKTVKTNVARDDDVVLRQKATCRHLISKRRAGREENVMPL